MRQHIVALLQEHPEGLCPTQVRQLLGVSKDLVPTMKAMVRDGLIRRIEYGKYTSMEK
jgi:Mn-dependent DtxR family transcriptional regulator